MLCNSRILTLSPSDEKKMAGGQALLCGVGKQPWIGRTDNDLLLSPGAIKCTGNPKHIRQSALHEATPRWLKVKHPDHGLTLGSPGMVSNEACSKFRGQQTDIIYLVGFYINPARPRKKACRRNEVRSFHLLSLYSFKIIAWSLQFITSLFLSCGFI